MEIKKGLGKGLGALLPSQEETNDNLDAVKEVKINEVEPNPDQPRREFDQQKLFEMAESIKEFGIIQPLVVRKNKDKYEIIAGERRWRAARLAGLSTVPVVIKEYTDLQVLQAALIENLQREDLNAIEEANGYQELIKQFHMTQDDVASVIGRSRPTIANTIRLLTLDEKVKKMVQDGSLSSGHARALVVVTDKKLQYELAQRIVKENLTVRDVERLLKTIDKKKVQKPKEQNPVFEEIESDLKTVLGTKVRIIDNKNKGKIEIEYYSTEDFERILALIKGY